MTTYVDPATINLAVDQPFTNAKAVALRDNPTAITEGASGAPQIHPSSALDDTITTDGSQGISASSTWTPSQGFYNMVPDQTGVSWQLYVSAAWRGDTGATSQYLGGGQFCDGTNMRIDNSRGSTVTIYYQRFDG